MMRSVTGNSIPFVKDLVLVGGGHAHVEVLKRFGMKPLSGMRLTLISKDPWTPYSGMLPGYLAGHYTREQSHIDLRPLCRFAGAQFFVGRVTGLDLNAGQIICENRPNVRFDFLSCDIGSTPSTQGIPGAREFALPVKPVDGFIEGWARIEKRIESGVPGGLRIVTVGGGAGGVELTLALQHRLLERFPKVARNASFQIVTASASILPGHNDDARRRFLRLLSERNVELTSGERVAKVEATRIHCASGLVIDHDVLIWVTHASGAPWIRESGLETDSDGFIAVNAGLQSMSHSNVFAAGDVAGVIDHPRPKSGVFAVRQGPPLAANLRRALTGRPPRPFKPQREFLSLISSGDRYAIASRGKWAVEGAWVWRWKNWIDNRWMSNYRQLSEMRGRSTPLPDTVADPAFIKDYLATPMRCGGCGAKVGQTVLQRVQARLKTTVRADVLVGVDDGDDAAVIVVPENRVTVQSVDYFRCFINDPFVFGQIAANHSLGDIYAMGAEPQSALAIAVLPFAAEGLMEEQLFQVMSGAVDVLNRHQTALAGGHTGEGAELAFGLAMQGLVDPERLLRKHGLQPGDRLILTRGLGTGILFAADMQGRARGEWIESAIAGALRSQRDAASILRSHQATACTDVTGFGLAGHLFDLINHSNVNADILFEEVPILEGAAELSAGGVKSSFQHENIRIRRAIAPPPKQIVEDARFPILFDPQTAGGLLAGVPDARAVKCLEALVKAGYTEAKLIGTVQPLKLDGPTSATPEIRLS